MLNAFAFALAAVSLLGATVFACGLLLGRALCASRYLAIGGRNDARPAALQGSLSTGELSC